MPLTFTVTPSPNPVNEGEYLTWTITAVGTFDYGTTGRWVKGVLSGTNITGEDVTEALGDLDPLSEAVLFHPTLAYPWPSQFIALTAITADQFTEGIETLTATLYTWLDGEPESTTVVGTASVQITDTSTSPINRLFYATPEGQSPSRRVTITNLGNGTLEVAEPVFSNLMTQAVPSYTGANYSSPPWSLATGQSASFGLKFLSTDYGQFNEYMGFYTNEAGAFTRVDLTVVGRGNRYYNLTPAGFVGNTSLPGFNFTATYQLIAFVNEVESPETVIEFVASMSGSSAWRVDAISANRVTVRFDPWRDRLGSGLYASTLIVSPTDPQYQTTTATNFANYQPDYTSNYNTVTYMTKLLDPDAIVGLRVDFVAGQRTLTIGVGSGADQSDPYRQELDEWFTVDNLSPMEGRQEIPFAFWQTVYQIPLQGTATTYLSSDYRVKTQEPDQRNYDYYFGHYASTGSMFIIEESSDGSVFVNFNDLRETSTDSTVNQTLDRLTRSFYYYSPKDKFNAPQNFKDPGPRDELGNVISVTTDYTVTNSGASAYLVDGSTNPTLTLIKGITYNFNVNSPGHPFWIKDLPIGGVTNGVNGVSNNGTDTGYVSFTVPYTLSTSTLYYICQYHNPMNGRIHVYEANTQMFRGFDKNNSVVTSLVNLPR